VSEHGFYVASTGKLAEFMTHNLEGYFESVAAQRFQNTLIRNLRMMNGRLASLMGR
jgi:hypothetical protein